MFSLNRYTLEFFQRHLASEPCYHSLLKELLSKADCPRKAISYNVREHPLSYRYKLARYGFDETRQEFINLHAAPPLTLERVHAEESGSPTSLGRVAPLEPESIFRHSRMGGRGQMKLVFVCSTFGSCAIRRAR